MAKKLGVEHRCATDLLRSGTNFLICCPACTYVNYPVVIIVLGEHCGYVHVCQDVLAAVERRNKLEDCRKLMVFLQNCMEVRAYMYVCMQCFLQT